MLDYIKCNVSFGLISAKVHIRYTISIMTGVTYVVMSAMLKERSIRSLLMWRVNTKAVFAS